MKIRTTALNNTASAQPKPAATKKEEAASSGPVDNYTGPEDRKSNPDLAWQAKARPWITRLHSAMVRKSPVKGLENLPMSGPHVYAPTHQSGIDPGLFFEIGVEDVRFMGAQEQFVGAQGPLFTKMGAFPVDRDNPGMGPLKHAKEILKDQKVGLLAFPEGGILGNGADGKVHPLKEGPAYMAIIGKAESIVPIAIHVGEDKETRVGETAVGTLVAAGAGLASYAAIAGGGPITRVVAGALSGALLGATSSTAMFGKADWNPYTDTLKEIKIGGIGALIGGIAGGITAGQFSSPFVGIGAGVASTVGGLTAANAFIHRPVAKMEVLQGLDVAAAVKEHGKKGARTALTEQVFESLSEAKHRLVFGDEAKTGS